MAPQNTHSHDQDDKLTHIYDRMMERVKQAWEQDIGQTTLGQLIEGAKEKAVALGEVTQQEAERIGRFLRRDLEDAAGFLQNEKAKEFVDWLRFDIERVEGRILELFQSVADKTKLEFLRLQERARHAADYNTGEVTGIGTLHCSNCGQTMHFHKTTRIPPCPKCHGTNFTRYKEGKQD